jgi:hypothetical protein
MGAPPSKRALIQVKSVPWQDRGGLMGAAEVHSLFRFIESRNNLTVLFKYSFDSH